MIILTGFDPFGKYVKNLSGQIINKLPPELDGFQFVKEIIPVSWTESIRTYRSIFSKLKSNPELAILLGIHTKKNIHLEVYGWNFRFGYDEDKKFKFGPIRLLSPPWIRTSININKTYANLEDKTKIVISYFPGFYLCNYIYYWALHLSKKEYPVLFIHIPDKGNEFEYCQKVKIILRSIIRIHLTRDLYI